MLRLYIVYAQMRNIEQVKNHCSDLLKMGCTCNWIYLPLYTERGKKIILRTDFAANSAQVLTLDELLFFVVWIYLLI